MPTSIAFLNLTQLPKSSALRLYSPATQGNSFWLDGFPALRTDADWLGQLVKEIEQWGVIGMTTNQTLLKQLMDEGIFDERLKILKKEGKTAEQAYWILYNEAATAAAKVFSAVHAQWPWEGRVSQEASALITEVDPLVKDVRRIARAMEKVGSFTKIPNLPIGPEAIQKAVFTGTAGSTAVPLQVIHPNITLVFSDTHYLQTVEAYIAGLTARMEYFQKQGFSEDTIYHDVEQVYSVDSLFVSRLDRVIDPLIDEEMKKVQGTAREKLGLLKGKVAVAQAKKIHQIFSGIFLDSPFSDMEHYYMGPEGMGIISRVWRLRERFSILKMMGAHPQRLLIASSGVKSDQPYSPLLYVLPFLGPWSANTAPEKTIQTLSQFMEKLPDDQTAVLKGRHIMREPLPALPTDTSPDEWDKAVLMTTRERKDNGIGEMMPGQILRDVQTLVLDPRKTSIRKICDELRDKGAESFRKDEEAALQAIQEKMRSV